MRPTRVIVSLVLSCCSTALAQEATVVGALPTDGAGHYVANRPPLAQVPLRKLPIGAIEPRGWLRHQLLLEADGMAGHLEEISPFLKFEGNGWIDPASKGGWEELPYWIKGFGDLGYVLNDARINAASKRWLEGILATQQPDGWFGPTGLRTSLDGRPDLWPHMPVLNAMQSWYEHTDDPRVLPFMTRYFRWLSVQPDDTFSLGYWPAVRWGDCLGSVHWLYNRTGDAFLLDLARRMHEHSAKWSSGIINGHNVNFSQGFREPAQYSVQSDAHSDLAATYANYEKMMGTYGQFPGGGFAGDENTRRGYTDARQGFETCGIVEYMSSFEMLTAITGDPAWADRCEELAFNSLPAALTPDLKALHYLTAANQVQLDSKNKSPGIDNGGTMFSYSPGEVYRCCQHNHAMGWPYYAEHLYLATADGGLLANLYSASEVTADVGTGTSKVTLTQETDYPFSGDISLKVSVPGGGAVAFPLYLRVPAWAQDARVAVNGKEDYSGQAAGKFVKVARDWRDGDLLSLHFGMGIRERTWPDFQGRSVSLYYGPLAMAYSPGEKWVRSGGSTAWPEYEVFPAGPFNYGLDISSASDLKVERRPGPLADQPFTPQTAPLSVKVQARKIPQWTVDDHDLLRTLQPSPARTDAPLETLTLIPMGAARLRISEFPVATASPDAAAWKLPPALPRVSYCFTGDTPAAIVDGILPASSHDQSIPRFTWWDHRGTSEWFELDIDPAKPASSLAVYWFEDSPGGGCRAPKSWTVLYRDGDTWKPVANASPAGTSLDAFNTVTFDEVRTRSLRVEVQLKDGFSAGVLEARVNGATPTGAPR